MLIKKIRDRKEILEKVNKVIDAYKEGLLGGENCRKMRNRNSVIFRINDSKE